MHQLTRHGSGGSKTSGAEFDVICRRCVLPLDQIGDRQGRTSGDRTRKILIS